MNAKDALRILKEKRLLAAGILVAILVFAAASLARCTEANAPAPQDGAQADGPPSSVEQAQDEARDEAEEETTSGELAPEIADKRSAYTDEALEAIAFLKANVWTDAGETSSLTFDEESFAETRQGERIVRTPYVITAMSGSVDSSAEQTQAGLTVGRSTIVLETPTGTHILDLARTSGAGSEESWMVASGAFSLAKSYTRAEAASGIAVEGPEAEFEEFGALVDGRTEELEEELGEYCSKYYPSATKATWSQTSVLDWAGGSISTTFVLDNRAKTQVSATYSIEGESFEIGSVR